jgi:prepilin-type N-terminal cleavage/methylation domain-containing protein
MVRHLVAQYPLPMKENVMNARKTNRGFTLIELLVVVAIIALLIAILLPALSTARMKANTAKCLVNTRSMVNAVNMYIADWKDMFPYSDNLPQSWTQLLYNGGTAASAGISTASGNGYGASDKIRACPEAPDVSGGTSGGSGETYGNAHAAWGNSPHTGGSASEPFGGSYGLNGWVYNGGSSLTTYTGNVPSTHYYRMIRGNTSPSDTPVFADANWRHVFATPGDAIPGGATLENPGPFGLFSHPICRMLMNRHNMQINVGFADNHAETVGLKNVYMVQWSPDWVAPAARPLPTQ